VHESTRGGHNPAVANPKHDRNLRAIARERFGYEDLFPGQEEAMHALLEGRDTLVVMPTGGGKSAIYQVPALLIDGPTIVVSPLIALQRDQVEGLLETGETDAAAVNSTLGDAERERLLKAFERGDLEYLLVAPEQLADPEFVARLARSRPSMFVVDEAHCISSWGHDFRPDYLRLGGVVEALGRPTTLALTATAAPIVRDEIIASLGMLDPLVVVQGFDRPNIHLSVEMFADEGAKLDALIDAVVARNPPGIVYVATKREAEELAGRLWTHGVEAVYYHGGMSRAEREEAQAAFMDDRFEVVVATSAFGMGIDKPNVRFVLHAEPPDSVDSLYQEIGRAGRDGEPADAVMFYRPQDLGLRRFFAAGDAVARDVIARVARVIFEEEDVSLDELASRTGITRRRVSAAVNVLARAGAAVQDPGGSVRTAHGMDADAAGARAAEAEEARKKIEESRVEMVRGYAETTSCRRRFLLTYFGEDYEAPCDKCDNCERGAAPAPDRPVGEEFTINAKVRHAKFGDGHVVRHDGDRIVVLFEDSGYKTLSASVMAESNLLEETR